MKCLNCGREAQSCLCQACHDPDTLDRVVTEILCYKEETCENEFVRAYMRQFEDPKEGRACIPELLAITLVIVLHLWKRQMLLSIAGGTIFYMILVQTLF